MNRRVEYRVVGEGWGWRDLTGPDIFTHLPDAEKRLKELEEDRVPGAHIQVHEVVETDWEPLPEEEANG